MKRFYLVVTLFHTILLPLVSQNLSSHLLITSLENASAPLYHAESDSIVFTYQVPEGRYQPRYVGIGYEHENFAPVYEFEYFERRNADGNFLSRVYYHFLPISTAIEELPALRYRYVIDGVWIEDPSNPNSTRKFSGRKISFVNLPDNRLILPESPLIIDDGNARSRTVHFIYHADPGEEIFLAGNFNNWDPFMYPLSENPKNAGTYEIKIRLLPGNYQYNYYYKGRRVKDPLNIQSSYDIEGYEYSYFSINL